MYHNFSELQDYCNRSHVLLWEAVLKNEIRITHEPVSYTHLDVYKRQRCKKGWLTSAASTEYPL